jgi:hypothetical protein
MKEQSAGIRSSFLYLCLRSTHFGSNPVEELDNPRTTVAVLPATQRLT